MVRSNDVAIIEQNRAQSLELREGSLRTLDYSSFGGPREQVMRKKQGHQLFVDILMIFFVCSHHSFRHHFLTK